MDKLYTSIMAYNAVPSPEVAVERTSVPQINSIIMPHPHARYRH